MKSPAADAGREATWKSPTPDIGQVQTLIEISHEAGDPSRTFFGFLSAS